MCVTSHEYIRADGQESQAELHNTALPSGNAMFLPLIVNDRGDSSLHKAAVNVIREVRHVADLVPGVKPRIERGES